MNKKIAYLIPNFFTVSSLICALIALNVIVEGHFETGAWLITLSLLFDGFDGKMARWLKATSRIGAQADSLADFVAFGVVPGFLAFQYCLKHFHTLGFLVFMVYVICGGYRLARFNVMSTNNAKKEDFTGLPIPAAAAIIASFVLFSIQFLPDFSFLLLPILCLTGWLMVSRIPYIAITKTTTRPKKTTALIIISLATIIYWAIKHTIWVYLIGSWAYVCYGLYNQIRVQVRKYSKDKAILKNKK